MHEKGVADHVDERFEHLDGFGRNWKTRDSFKLAYAGGGLDELA